MPAFYKIDKERRVVLSTASGVFTLADAVSHMDKLSKDPDFDPSFPRSRTSHKSRGSNFPATTYVNWRREASSPPTLGVR